MKKIYHLSTCDTCRRIIKELGDTSDFEFQDIKEKNIEPYVLDQLAKDEGAYESLFSRRARKYRAIGLAGKELSEKDYRELILKEYTFLKRPVIIIDEKAFIGSAKSVVQSAVDEARKLRKRRSQSS